MDEQQFRWRPTRRQVVWTAGIVVALVVAVVLFGGYFLGWKWTGLVKDANYPKRTLWDWLQLLIIPAVLAGGTIWFNRRQQQRDQESAKQRAQDEALQAYLDHMSQLLTDKDRPLHSACEGDSVSTVARARTLTVLPTLDSERKRSVLQFLYDSKLIIKGRRVLDLDGADLSGAFVSGAVRWRADLPDLLSGRFIVRVSTATLTNADLRGAVLSGANLWSAHLQGADLRGADLSKAELSQAKLLDADLRGAGMREATLWEANLTRADLRDAVVTDEQLRQALFLEGTTMPNGQKYEDWLKDKARRGEHLTESEKRYVDELQEAYVRWLQTPQGQKWLKDKEGRGDDGENSGPS
jgi:hypothetical protein